MTQKIILAVEKTAKKASFFQEQKPKRFARKRSDRDKSIDSKRSRQGSFNSHYIKNPAQQNSLQISRIHDEAFNFVENLESQHKSRKTMYTRTNTNRQRVRDENALNLRIQMLETQNRVKQGQCERLRIHLDEERQKRRKSQNQKRTIIKQIQEIQKINEKISIENKKLIKEKQYLMKQVQFLQKINYDQKTRQMQSFRQKYMAQQLQKIRNELKSKKSNKQLELQKQIQKLRYQKDSAQDKFKSMKSMVSVLKGRIQKLNLQLFQQKQFSKQKILSSQQYIQIKERYRRFIQTYKQIRSQNWNLRNILEGKQADLVLSDSEQQNFI